MGIVKRQFLKASTVTYFGVILGYINITLLFPYFCTPEELGLYRVIINMSSLFATIASLGIPQMIDKQFPHFKKLGSTFHFFAIVLIMQTIAIGLSLIFIYFLESDIIGFFEKRSPLIGDYFQYAILIGIALSIYNAFRSFIKTKKLITFPIFLREIFVRLASTTLIIMFGYGLMNFYEFFILLSLTFGLMMLISGIYTNKIMPLRFNFSLNQLERKEHVEVISVSLFSLLAGTSHMIVLNADTIMISAYSPNGLNDTGVYSIAFFIGAVLDIPKRMMAQIFTPLVAEHWVNKNMEEIEGNYKSSATNGLIIGALLFTLIWTNIESFYQIIPNSELYTAGISVVLLILIARMFEIAFGIAPVIMTQSRLYIYNFPISILLVVLSISLNYVLIPDYGIYGAGLATLSSLLIYKLVKVFVILQQFKMHFLSLSFFKALLIFLLALAMTLLVPKTGNIIADIVARSVVGSTLILIPVYYFKISEPFNSTVDNLIKFIRSKF